MLRKECYTTLPVLKKLKLHTHFYVWKQIAESIILSKLASHKILFDNIPTYTKNRLQKVQNETASFVLNKYAKIKHVLKWNWLTRDERIGISTLIVLFKALYDHYFPNIYNYIKSKPGSFVKQCVRSFNNLPLMIQFCTEIIQRKTKHWTI